MIRSTSEKGAGDAVAAILDRAHSASHAQQEQEGRIKPQEAGPYAAQGAKYSAGRFWSAVIGAGLTGTIAGAALVAAAIWYGPAHSLIPADPRIESMERRMDAAETRLAGFGEDMERLSVQVAEALDGGESAVKGLAAQQEAVEVVGRKLAALAEELAPGAHDRLPVLAVAVAQLRAAFAAGGPFEPELVNVYHLARSDSALLPRLTELTAPARTGVANADALRRQLHMLAATDSRLRIGEPQTYYDYGLSLVNQYIGVAHAPYEVEYANQALREADSRLQQNDVAGAAAALAQVDPQILRIFQPFLDEARAHERVRLAMQEIKSVAMLELQEVAARDGGTLCGKVRGGGTPTAQSPDACQ